MKKTIKFLIALALLFSVTGNLILAQNDGYAGKRILLKTDLLSGKKAFLTGLDAEFILFRHSTISVGIRFFKNKSDQKYLQKDYYDGPTYANVDKPKVMPQKASLKTLALNIEYRRYLKLFRPAPYGPFVYASLQAGWLTVTNGMYYRAIAEYDVTADKPYDEYVKYNYKNLPFFLPEAGFGYQAIFKNKFAAGMKAGINYTIFDSSLTGTPKEAIIGVKNTYGGNIANVKVGLSAYLQIGYLF
jgi:hypothetical protein